MCESYYCNNSYACCPPYTDCCNLCSNCLCKYLRQCCPFNSQCQPTECKRTNNKTDIMPVSFRKLHNMPSKVKQFQLNSSLGKENKLVKSLKLKKKRSSITKDKESINGNKTRKKKPSEGDTDERKSEEETKNDTDNLGSSTSSLERMCKSDSNIACDTNNSIYQCSFKPTDKPWSCNDTSPKQSCGNTIRTDSTCAPDSSSCESQNSSLYSTCLKNYNDYIMETVRKACQGITSDNNCCPPKQKSNTMNCCCTLQRASAPPQSPAPSSAQAPSTSNCNYGHHCNCRKTTGRPRRFRSVGHLGAIKEEENEDEAQNTDAMISDMQKSLENSCTDLLNIVTDNILESVQKYVTKTLQEYCCKTTQKMDLVCKKLERAQKTMCSLYGNMVEEITQKNQNNLDQVLHLLTELKKDQDNKRDRYSKVFYEHRESQCDVQQNPIETKKAGPATNLENVANSPAAVAKTGAVPKTGAVSKHGSLAKSNEKGAVNNNEETTKICQCCPACGGNRKPILKTVIIHKSFSSSTILQSPICCDSKLDLTEDQCDDNVKYNKREKGGGNREQTKETTNLSKSSIKDRNLNEIEALFVRKKSVEPLNRFTDKTAFEENPLNFKPNISLNTTTDVAEVTPSSSRPNSPNTFTSFSITPTGKTIFNCNCQSKKQISTASKAVDTSELHLCESYDTSGYASEPDDDNDINANIGATKVISKTIPMRLQYVPLGYTPYSEIPIRIKTKTRKHSKKRSSSRNGNKAPPTTPTRLSRL